MEPLVAVLIGLLGTAIVGGLGFILTGLRAAVLTNSDDIKAIGKQVGGLEVGFGRLEGRLGGLEVGFGGLEERFGGLEGRFGGLEGRLGGLEVGFGGLEERFGGLEERAVSEFGQVKDVLARIEATQAEQGRQIEKLSGGDLG